MGALALWALLPAGVARADDASVERAYTSQFAEFAALNAQLDLTQITWGRTDRDGPLLRSFARARALIARLRRAILAQESSTPTGAAARAALLLSLGRAGRAFVSFRAAIFAWRRADFRQSDRRFDRGNALIDQSNRAELRALRLFARASTAVPDDSSVKRAYTSYDGAFAALRPEMERALAKFARNRAIGQLPVLVWRGLNLIVPPARRAVLGESASTPIGAAARTAALRSLELTGYSLLAVRDAVLEYWVGRDKSRSSRLLARGKTLAVKAERADRQARELFAQARAPAAAPARTTFGGRRDWTDAVRGFRSVRR